MSKVLVVEDSNFLRADLCDELAIWGYDVTEAADGMVGFELIRKCRPNLVLSDINMPKMNGFQMMRHAIQLGGEFVRTPFLFLSGLECPNPAEYGISLNDEQLVVKPVDYDVLRARIDALIVRNRPLVPNIVA